MQKLETYNRFVLATLGTVALLVMAIGAGSLTYDWLRHRYQSFKNSKASDGKTESSAGASAAATPAANNARAPKSDEASSYAFGHPVVLKGTDTILLPVLSDDSLPTSVWSRSADESDPDHPVNLLFVDAIKGTHRTLLPQGGIVVGYAPVVGDAGTLGVLCSVIESDTNKSGALDDDDDEVTYLVSPTGAPLRRLGPDDARLFDWSLDAAHGQLILVFRTAEEPMRVFRAALASTDRGSEIFDDSAKQTMRRAAHAQLAATEGP